MHTVVVGYDCDWLYWLWSALMHCCVIGVYVQIMYELIHTSWLFNLTQLELLYLLRLL